MSGKIQNKYKSHSAFQRGVANVNELLSDGERMVMSALAVAVDYKTATSRPGNGALMQQSNRSMRGVQEILKGLRKRGLLERVSEGDGGRGLATVHRFCIEDNRYPCPKPRSNSCGDSESDEPQNPAVRRTKPRSLEGKTPQLEPGNPAVATAVLPKILPINPSINPSSSASKPSDRAEQVAEFFRKRTGKVLSLSTPTRRSLETAIAEYGLETMLETVNQLAVAADWSKIVNPAGFFLSDSGYPQYIGAAQEAIREAIRERREREAILADVKEQGRELDAQLKAEREQRLKQAEFDARNKHVI